MPHRNINYIHRVLIHGLLLAIFLFLAAYPGRAGGLALTKVFGDNMVLQRDRAVPVWGWAEPGQKITVAFAGQEKTASAGADGKWMVRLDPLKANKNPAEMKVSGAGANTVTLKNILVGEVWLCSGDWGMARTVLDAANAKDEYTSATNPIIRHMGVKLDQSATPLADIQGGAWTVCSPGFACNYSGVGYFFARELARELDVPVGLINASWGLTRIEPWICPEGYRQVPELKDLTAQFEAWDSTTEIGRAKYIEYAAKIQNWVTQAEAALAGRQKVPDIPESPLPPNDITQGDHQLPTKIFNGMINPLVPFAIRGVIWYQGEANGNEGLTYLQKLKALIGGWRQRWNQGDFPFLIVQLPNWQVSDLNNAAGGDGWAKIREAQLQAVSVISNVGLAVSIDIAVANDSYQPKNKQDAGARLARWALAKDYQKNIVASGPLYKSFQAEGGKIRVEFDNVGSGLMVGEKTGLEPAREVQDGKIKWVAIAGEDKVWQWADAVIDGATLVVSSAKVPNPVAVRYAFTWNPVGVKLYNREGLPASPFRTDDW